METLAPGRASLRDGGVSSLCEEKVGSTLVSYG